MTLPTTRRQIQSAVAASVGERMRKAAETARAKEHLLLTPMTSPPTISTSTSDPDAAVSRQFRLNGTGSTFTQGSATTNSKDRVRLIGGIEKVYATNYTTAYVLTKPGGSGGNTQGDATKNTYCYAFVFSTDAPKIKLRFLGSSTKYQIEVDDQPVSATPLSYASSSGTVWTLLDFGSSVKRRKIRIEMREASGLDSIYVGPLYDIHRVDSATNLKAVIVGDSISTGTGTTDGNGAWFPKVAKLLGWSDYRQCGWGSSGVVVAPAGTNTFGSAQRVADVVAHNPDVLVLSGSGNDNGQSGVQAAWLATMQAYRTALPNVPIVVMGVQPASSGPNAASITTENSIKAAFDQWADGNSWWIPVCTDAAGPWEDGTGWSGSRTVTDLVTTNASAIITSATAAFSSADVGHTIQAAAGSNLFFDPTTIASVQSATQATMSRVANVTGTGGTATIFNTTGTGSRDRFGADAAHHNDSGAENIARRFNEAMRRLVLPNVR